MHSSVEHYDWLVYLITKTAFHVGMYQGVGCISTTKDCFPSFFSDASSSQNLLQTTLVIKPRNIMNIYWCVWPLNTCPNMELFICFIVWVGVTATVIFSGFVMKELVQIKPTFYMPGQEMLPQPGSPKVHLKCLVCLTSVHQSIHGPF